MAVYCQYFPDYDYNEGHQRTDSRTIRHVNTAHSNDMVMDTPHSDINMLKYSTFFPKSLIKAENHNERETYSTVTLDNQEQFHSRNKSELPANIMAKSESKSTSPWNTGILEKCTSLMKDHYCVDEICYLLNIPHSLFYDIVNENSKKIILYYVVRDL